MQHGRTARPGREHRRSIRRAATVCVALLLSLLSAPTPAAAATLPTGFTQATLASGLGPVTAMAFAPDGRLSVLTQNGSVRILRNGQLLSRPFLQLPVNYAGERGLLGIAFDPAFASNGFVYLHYTVRASPAFNRISRFVADGDMARTVNGVPAETVLTNLDPLSDRLLHNSGALAFGPDGKLYTTTGDNGDGSTAQSLSNRMGKILRLNADGSIPADNPFYSTGAAGANRAIWALGLRNPYTFDFSSTGRLHVNDVGQDSWEEVNQGVAGSNYGWPATEGPTTDPRFRSPVYAYGHSGTAVSGCAITGGAFYDPTTPRYPSDYVGDYFFADYCGNWIKRRDASGTVTPFLDSSSPQPIDLDVGPDGNLYYLSRGAQSVVRVDFPAGQAPAVTQHPASRLVSVGDPASFTVSATGAAPLTYQWQRNGVDIGGATSSTYRIAQTTLTDDGARLRCLVRNSVGSVVSSEAVLSVTSDKRPSATISSPSTGTTYAGGDVIAYSGTGTDPESGTLPGSAMTWWVDFHHAAHTHPFLPATSGAAHGSFTVPRTGHLDSNVWYRIHLRVKDGAGLTAQTYRDVVPRRAGLTVDTLPAGLRVDVDDQPRTAPYQEQAVVGLQRRLSAPATQVVSGVEYEFVSWSDGGSATHDVITAATATTYTATYRVASRTVTVDAVADTMARQAAPATASGSVTTLLADSRQTTSTTSRATSYLRFTVPTLAAGETITGARLSLQVTDATTNGPAVWRTGTTWSESTLTWSSGRPARTGTAAVGNFTAMATGRVSTALTGITPGTVSVQLHADTADRLAYASRETTTRPQLVLTITRAG